jgi:SpoVK/Ycf46/Vps4 family AAA+-type ATPase
MAPRSILLYGPAGAGKTLLVRAVAGETGTNLLEMVPTNIFSRWVGESERSLGDLFRTARQSTPCFLFLDHLEVLAPAGEISQDAHLARRLIAQLKHEMEQATKVDGLYVFAATSRPEMVDKGVWSGFEVRLEVPLPDLGERELLLRHFLGQMPVEVNLNLNLVAERTEGMTPGGLLELCRRAYLIFSAGQEPSIGRPVIEQTHFEQALATNPR